MQDRYGTTFFYDKSKNTELLKPEKTKRKNFLLILNSYSRDCDCRVLSFLC